MSWDAIGATFVIAIAFVTTGCMSLPVIYQRVEDSPLWVNNDQLSVIVAEGRTRDEVISGLGPAGRDDETRGLGYQRCLESNSWEALILFPPIPLPAKGRVYDCQFIAVWFNEDGHAVRVGSGRMNFELAPFLTQQSLHGVPYNTPQQAMVDLLVHPCRTSHDFWKYVGKNPACVNGAFASESMQKGSATLSEQDPIGARLQILSEQGTTPAQRDLACMDLANVYLKRGIYPQDYIDAYVWFSIVAATSESSQMRADATKSRDLVASKLDATQVVEAERGIRQWTAFLSNARHDQAR